MSDETASKASKATVLDVQVLLRHLLIFMTTIRVIAKTVCYSVLFSTSFSTPAARHIRQD